MNGREAIKLLVEAGFVQGRDMTAGHHYLMTKGSDRIMVNSTAHELPRSLRERIKKLAAGTPGAQDVARHARRQDEELPAELLRVGDRVSSVVNPGRLGTVRKVYYEMMPPRCEVEWQEKYLPGSTGLTYLPMSSVQLLRAAKKVEPEKVPEKIPSSESEETMDQVDNEKDNTDTGAGGLLAQVKGLQSAAESEWLALTTDFAERVRMYDKVAALLGAVGIEVEPLPWVLVDREEAEMIGEPPLTEAEEEEERVAAVAARDFAETTRRFDDIHAPAKTSAARLLTEENLVNGVRATSLLAEVLVTAHNRERIMAYLLKKGTIRATKLGQAVGSKNWPYKEVLRDAEILAEAGLIVREDRWNTDWGKNSVHYGPRVDEKVAPR